MTKSLIIRCPECGKVTQLFDLRRTQPAELGCAVQQAAREGLRLELSDGPFEVGCECAVSDNDPPTAGSCWSTKRLRFNLLQVLLVVTVVAIGLAIFRHPISLLFDETVLQWSSVPWSLYGWLFFGTDIINPKTLAKDPMGIIMFLANVAIAGVLPMLAASLATSGFKRLWQMAGKSRRSPRS